jgi:dolichol-phosphate mannosyltransferase
MRVVSSPAMPPVSVIVPCFNEEEGIPSLLHRLEPLGELGWEVVFVDDGSRDGSFGILLSAARSRPWIRVVHHVANRGVGAALRTGFGLARAPIVCTIDCDCTHPPERLPELVRAIEDGADVVTAVPRWIDAAPTDRGAIRQLLSNRLSALYGGLVSRDVHTFTCLFRAYRREVLDRTSFRSSGFAAVTEIMVRSIWKGFQVREVPMRLAGRRFGVSKRRTGRAIVAHVRTLGLAAVLGAASRVRSTLS